MKCALALSVALAAAVAAASAQTTPPLDVTYRDAASRLIGAAMVDTGGYDKLAYLTTRIGNRLSGSPALDRAVSWVAEQMTADGLVNVRTQPVKVPYWIRGNESAQVVRPIQRPLNMLGLGRSIATPKDGITARVVVVASFDELESLGADKVKGTIVLYDMPWQDYARTVMFRNAGASRAARLGAVASLIRSVTPRGLVHTAHRDADLRSRVTPNPRRRDYRRGCRLDPPDDRDGRGSARAAAHGGRDAP